MTPVETSLFCFEFRMLPWPACTNLYFDRVQLPEHFSAVCTRDLLCLQTAALPDNFEHVLALAQTIATSFIDAHAYFAFPHRPALGIELVSWLEVKETEPRGTVLGYADQSLELIGLSRGHPDNAPFELALRLMPHVCGNSALGLALADFRAARGERGAYSSFYSFRVLEDIAYSFDPKGREAKWKLVNKNLGTDEAHWQKLTDGSKLVRHLRPSSRRQLTEADRQASLALAKDALDRWLSYLALERVTSGLPLPACLHSPSDLPVQ